MSDFLLALIVVLLLAILAAILLIVFELKGMRGILRLLTKLDHLVKTTGHHHIHPLDCLFFSIWIFEGAKWILHRRCGQKGCDCGPPPAIPGEFEGQVVRKECPSR
jgi:hypothetical protein